VVSRQLAMYRAGAWLGSALPERLCYSLAEGVGRTAAAFPDLDGKRAMVASHMRRVMGRPLGKAERRRMVGDVFANYARYWSESLRLPSTSHEHVAAGTALVGFENVQAGLDAGRGVIIVTPHLGGWEWGAFYLTGIGLPMTVAVERLQPDDLFDWFARFRELLGMQVVPVGPSAAGLILKALRDNHVVCLLADRLVGEATGAEVEFFGGTARLPAGPATLALRSGATLMTAAIYYRRPEAPHTIVFRPPLELPQAKPFRESVMKATQALAYELQELIRAAPTQWHLVQPNWTDDPPLRRPWRSRHRRDIEDGKGH
jgi:phosphatidylinositol dimannoside acyltransferase